MMVDDIFIQINKERVKLDTNRTGGMFELIPQVEDQ